MKKGILLWLIFTAAILHHPAWAASKAGVFIDLEAGTTELPTIYDEGTISASVPLTSLHGTQGQQDQPLDVSGTGFSGLTQNRLQLASYAFASGGGSNRIDTFAPFGAANVRSRWDDTLRLTPPQGLGLPPSLTFVIEVSGSLNSTTAWSFGRVVSSFAGEIVQANNSLGVYYFVDPDWDVFLNGSGSYSVVVPVNQDFGLVFYTFTLASYAETKAGDAISNYSSTATIRSITLADGSTPESKGYNLAFDSGMLSPNVAPLPGSIILLLSGLFILAAGRRQNKP